MLLLRPLYEAWLLKATETPLAPWQRAMLLRALQRDEALRCFALELAELNHAEAPAALKAPDLRARLHAALHAENAPAPAWQPHWSWAAAAVLALALASGLWWQGPAQAPSVEVAAVHQEGEVKALRLPSSTPTPTTVPSAVPTVTVTPSPTPSPSATPTP